VKEDLGLLDCWQGLMKFDDDWLGQREERVVHLKEWD
jgi:hypothetical protein